MFPKSITLALAALGLAGAAAVSGVTASETGPNGMSCEIRAEANGSMISIEPVVHGDPSDGGSYTFRVAASSYGGSSNISQGGNFAIPQDGSAVLGRVALGNNGTGYDAELKVNTAGGSFACVERIGGGGI